MKENEFLLMDENDNVAMFILWLNGVVIGYGLGVRR